MEKKAIISTFLLKRAFFCVVVKKSAYCQGVKATSGSEFFLQDKAQRNEQRSV